MDLLDIPNEYTGESPAGQLADVAGAAREKPRVSTPEEAAKLPPGTSFIGPDSKERIVPYKVTRPEQIADIPDGADFTGPDGKLRQKPKYEGIDFTPQTLYDIAHSDKGRKMALEKFYPGQVRDDPSGGFYIEDEGGKFLKPGRGVSKVTGFLASETIPMVLTGAGSLLGGAAGTVMAPGAGTVLGGAAGGYAGGYLAQGFNDIISQLAGVYESEGAEHNKRMAGAVGMAGDVGGRAVSAIAPTVKEGAKAVWRGAGKTVGKVLGVNAENLETGIGISQVGEIPGAGPFGLSKPGTAVSPSAMFETSPHLTNVAEILQQKFDKSDTYLANAERFMDKRAKEILAKDDIGSLVEGSLVHPEAAVSTEEAGHLLKRSAQEKAVQKSAEHDAELAQALANRKAAIEEKYAPDIEAHRSRNEAVVSVAEKAKRSADELVQQGFKDIEKDADAALTVAKAGYSGGDLWRNVAEKFVSLRRTIGVRMSKMVGDAEQASGGLVPSGSDGLAADARALLNELPEGFESLHPSIVRRVSDMAGTIDEKTGEFIKEPVQATWVQLHELRTHIRQDIKWNDLTSDVKNGTLKFLESKINNVLHDVENQPALQEASKLLKLADAFYRENMGPLNNTQLRTLVRALNQGGVQADPKALLKVAIQDGKTETAELIKKTVGPQTWDAMRAADVKEMLSQSQTLAESGAVDGIAFAKQVLDRKKNGVLDVLHGKEGANRLEQQARYVEQLRGKLEIQPRPGDTVNDVIMRARSAVADAEAKAATDPLKALQNEMKQVIAETKKNFAEARKTAQANDPLGFLLDPNVGAHKAVDRILKDPDLIVAASRAFPGGEKSPEFQLMRQIWAENFLRETLEPGEKLAATKPEVQALMFPGVTLDDMRLLAREMKLLMSGKTAKGGGDEGASIMANTAVENPAGRASGLGKLAGPVKLIPGSNFALRAMLEKYYTTIRGVVTSPSTLRWLRQGLTSRDPVAREAARAEFQAALQRGGAMGADAAQAAWGGQSEGN